MGTPREPDTGVSGNGGDAASWSNGKKKENRGRPGHITQSLDDFECWGQGDL